LKVDDTGRGEISHNAADRFDESFEVLIIEFSGTADAGALEKVSRFLHLG
jgi:hypothetical protein